MRWLDNMADKIKTGIKSWLRIEPAQRNVFRITETLDYESNAIKNRIWYRGDSEELSQLYSQMPGDKTRFWAATCTPGLEIRKIHTGLPGMIAEVLTSIVVADMNDIEITASRQAEWEEIAEDNSFNELVSESLAETLYIGDGAFKISFDTVLSKYPIIEFYSGDKIDISYDRGRVKEVIFKTIYQHDKKEYLLLETYGYGYINYSLQREGKEVDITSIPQTAALKPVTWTDNFCMAVLFKIFKSSKWKGRGKSIFDGKADNFDSFDESWSQWMDALRKNRTKEYIPVDMMPRNPSTGEVLKPNAFDNSYIETETPMGEGAKKEIRLVQGTIPHESYLSTYVTALDLCLQGLISPSTLGIDVKKLDNAEAQREKEKATLYTRNKIVEAMQNTLPKVINTTMKAWDTWNKKLIEELEVEVPFGEYANPSFESQVETVGKGKTQGIMSIEACVDELYGDSKDDDWKAEEVKRLKAEQGIAEMEEPALNMEGVELDESQGNEQDIPNESKGVPGTATSGV
jgi:hypothetical protein